MSASKAFHTVPRLLVALIAVLLAVSTVLVAAPAHASDETASQKRVVKVGYIDYDGFIEQNSLGNYQGYGVEFLSRIADEAGWSIEYVYRTWSDLVGTVDDDGQRANSLLLDGEVDIVIQAQSTPERAADFLFSKYPTGYESTVVYCRQGDRDQYFYDDTTSLAGKRVGMLQGSYQTEAFEQRMEDVDYTPVYFANDVEMSTALTSGAVDVMVAGSLSAFSNVCVLMRIDNEPFYCMTSPQNIDLMDEYNEALSSILIADPSFEGDLMEKWYSSSAADTSVIYTREETEYLKSAPVITVGVHAVRAPISYLDSATGKLEGITETILDEVSAISGLKFEYVALDTSTAPVTQLREGKFDLVAGISRATSFTLDPTLTLSNVYFSSTVVPVVKRGDVFDASKNLTVAIPGSYQILREYIEGRYPNLTIATYETNTECLEAVASGTADVTMQNENMLNYELQAPRFSDLEVVRSTFFSEELAIAGLSETTDPALISIINKSIAAIPQATIDQIAVSISAANPYEYTLGDLWYRYWVPLVAVAGALLVIGVFTVVVFRARRRNTLQLEEKNRQLARSITQAQSANGAKSDFLAQMSHDIRTPMNAIIGLTEIAKGDVKSPERTLVNLSKIDDASKVLLSLINNILDMSTIENKRLKIDHSPFNLVSMLKRLAVMFYTQSKNKGVEFTFDASGVIDEFLVGDQHRLNQILMNMLSNAVKFTPRGGHVAFSAAAVQHRDNKLFMRFVVSDNGEGMSEDTLARVFQPFEQADAGTARRHGGNGLGMAIAKNLVDCMHGSISVQSALGKGTTFTVDLPFDIALDMPGDDVRSGEAVKNLKVLLADNDPDLLKYAAIIFDHMGVSCEFVGSGEEALDAIGEAEDEGHPFDVCFVDWKMPQMDGLETTRQIRQIFGDNIKIVMVTGFDLDELTAVAHEAGANELIEKPFFQSTLFDVLANLSAAPLVKETVTRKSAYDFKGLNILLVEDVDVNRDVAEGLIEMVNATVYCAVDGMDAIDVYEAHDPGFFDVVLMDINMPRMDGYESTRGIRRSERPDAATIPIYAMTANAFTEDIAMALNVGMNGHIAKPIDTKVLYGVLDKVYQASEAARAARSA